MNWCCSEETRLVFSIRFQANLRFCYEMRTAAKAGRLNILLMLNILEDYPRDAVSLRNCSPMLAPIA